MGEGELISHTTRACTCDASSGLLCKASAASFDCSVRAASNAKADEAIPFERLYRYAAPAPDEEDWAGVVWVEDAMMNGFKISVKDIVSQVLPMSLAVKDIVSQVLPMALLLPALIVENSTTFLE